MKLLKLLNKKTEHLVEDKDTHETENGVEVIKLSEIKIPLLVAHIIGVASGIGLYIIIFE